LVSPQSALPILTENCRPYWLLYNQVSIRVYDFLKWALVDAQITVAPQTSGKPNRFKNLKCNLVIVPGPHIDCLKAQPTDDAKVILSDLLTKVKAQKDLGTNATLVTRLSDIDKQNALYVSLRTMAQP
jgi:hypothetical protein